MTDEQILWGDEGYQVSIVYPEKKGNFVFLRYNIKIPVKKLRQVT